MIWLLALIVVILVIGHYGLPEQVNPSAYQETPSAIKIMRGAEPFRLQGKTDVGFLLVHGFEDSPYTMRNIGNLLHSEGHTVIAPLLPGHGTNIRDFAKTRYEHWLTMVRETYLRERPRFRHFFLIGFSMGGNLCLNLATELAGRSYNQRGSNGPVVADSRNASLQPTGIVTIAAPVVLNGFLNGTLIIKDPRLFLSGIMKNFFRHIPKAKSAVAEQVMIPWVGYGEAYTLAPLHSFKLGVASVRTRLHRIKQPLCMIHATGDKTVHIENMHYIFRKVASTEKRAYVFSLNEELSTHHVLVTHQLARDKVFHYIMKFVHDTLRGFDLKPAIFDPGGDKSRWVDKLRRFRGFLSG
jgi:carboxylesterase